MDAVITVDSNTVSIKMWSKYTDWTCLLSITIGLGICNMADVWFNDAFLWSGQTMPRTLTDAAHTSIINDTIHALMANHTHEICTCFCCVLVKIVGPRRFNTHKGLVSGRHCIKSAEWTGLFFNPRLVWLLEAWQIPGPFLKKSRNDSKASYWCSARIHIWCHDWRLMSLYV